MDSKTPFGYAIAFLVEVLGSFFTSFIVIPNLNFAIASLWVIRSFVKDIARDLPTLNVSKVSRPNNKIVFERFCSIVQQLSDAKQLSKIGKLNKFIFILLMFIPSVPLEFPF